MRCLALTGLVLCGCAFADDLPCNLGGYHVLSKTTIALDCGMNVSSIAGTATVFTVVNNSVSGGPVATGVFSGASFKFYVVDLNSGELKGGTDYELQLSGKSASSSAAFDTARVRISTAAAATVTTPIREKPSNYRYGGELWINSPVELDASTQKDLRFYSEDAPGDFVEHRVEVFIEPRNADTSFNSYGTARLTFAEWDEPKQLNSRLRIKGLKNIFSDEVIIKMKKRLAPASSPKMKDDAIYYSKLLHQAGVNSKPAFILDGKLAPAFPLGRLPSLEARPSAIADVGQGGAIGKTKTNDLIQFGVGLGRFIRTEGLGILQGIDPTLGPVYETNYALVHKNMLVAFDTPLYFAGTDHSLKQQNYMVLVNARLAQKDPNLQPQDVQQKRFGYKWSFSVGVEAGSQISDETAKASSGSSKVTVPGYSIARIKPTVSVALEFTKVLTLTLSTTPRYLFTTENVYRERDSVNAAGAAFKQVYLTTIKDWRPAAQADLSISLDEAGHYALSSTFKAGSLPPNFERVAIIQSGITIKF